MITREEFNLLLEREGIEEFIHARSYNKETQLYEMANGYYGMIFRIFPSPYLGYGTEKKIGAFLSLNFPENTIIQYNTYSSRNISDYIQAYDDLHTNKENNPFRKAHVGNPEFLDIMAKSGIEWLRKFSNRSIFEEDGIDFYLRDYVNLCSIMIPHKNPDGSSLSEDDLKSFFAQIKGGLADFNPQVFGQKQYIKFMREILNPAFPMWTPPADVMTELNSQISDTRSAVELDRNGRIVFGSLSDKEGSRIDVDSQVEPPKMIKFKIQNWLYNRFGIGEEAKDKRNINPAWYANVLTTKMYPEYIDLSSMSDIIMDYLNKRPQILLPIPFMMSLTISVGNKDKMIKNLSGDAKWNMFQLTNAAGAAKFMPELKDRAMEAKNIINLMSTQGEIPFKSMWSITLFAEKETQLDRYTATLQKEFLGKNWNLQKEELIQLPVLLYSLPLQFDEEFFKWSQRFNTLFRANNASIVPMLTDSRGFGLPVIQLIGRNGQLQGLDIFDKSATNKNFVTIAPSGSGKSYFMAFFFLNYLMTGAKIRVIDSGESYLKLCTLVGGKYIRFDEASTVCMNFFTDISTDEAGDPTEEALESIIPIIGMMAKIDLNESASATTSQDEMDKAVITSYVSSAIKDAYTMEGNDAGMKEVYLALDNMYNKQKRDLERPDGFNHDVDAKLRDLITALKPYGDPKGEYYSYLNGRKNISFDDSDFVVLEMLELEGKGNLRNVVLMSLAYTIENEFYFDDKRKKKILAIDEAWSLLENKIVARFVEGLYRKSRKFAGSVGTITQSIGDFYKNAYVKALYENSFWKFFLQPDKERLINSIHEKQISMDELTQELMLSVKTRAGVYSEVMCRTGNGGTSIGKIISTRTLHWVFTTNDEDVSHILNFSEKFGISAERASLIIGYAEDKGISIDDSAEEILRMYGNSSASDTVSGQTEELLDLV